MGLLGEDHAEGIGQVLHLALCRVLLQDGEHLLLHLGLVAEDVIHLQRGARTEEGRAIELTVCVEMCLSHCRTWSASEEGTHMGRKEKCHSSAHTHSNAGASHVSPVSLLEPLHWQQHYDSKPRNSTR